MLYLVTFAYPNNAHARTETFDNESEAFAFFHSITSELDQSEPVFAIRRAVFLTALDGYTSQLLEKWGDSDLAHEYPLTRLQPAVACSQAFSDGSRCENSAAPGQRYCRDCTEHQYTSFA